MTAEHKPPERLKHVFEHFGIEPKDPREVPREFKTGFVYLIQCNEFVKIGITYGVVFRFAQLQCANPHELKLLKSFHSLDVFADEVKIQKCLSRYYERGEWYSLPKPVLESLIGLDDLSRLHTLYVNWGDNEQGTVQPFMEDYGKSATEIRLSLRRKYYKFIVTLSGKRVFSGRVIKSSPTSPIYIRPTRSNEVPTSDQDRIEAAIKSHETDIELNSRKYTVKYGNEVIKRRNDNEA